MQVVNAGRHDIGVRMALGASPGRIVGSVVEIVAGAVLAMALRPASRALIFGVGTTDVTDLGLRQLRWRQCPPWRRWFRRAAPRPWIPLIACEANRYLHCGSFHAAVSPLSALLKRVLWRLGLITRTRARR